MLQEPLVCKDLEPQMQALTRTYMVVIEDFDHMAIMDENLNWTKLTYLLSKFSLNLKAFFCTSTFYFKTLITFLDIHTRESNTSPYVYYG